ncbi:MULTISPECIES: TetR/AcrR family transcriptional regulator [Mycolicibacterium]|uniref:Transcriptional regulator, tetR family n=3 Tax=Mycolicibacterium gilvum TaxID=1804 RepID=E6TNS8_MYCSR|nr:MULTISPECIES: TetR/AcrR family transcriptional regulator [Mycolicibacterium]ABP42735.1 putative transcriptional regulator, TetR family [Mycolicibacterium gilvum PYR-GCK]ADT97245.1 transcriptional regulator, tetR family [Mycolicibacterium gilvum Spyr1]MBV5245265.1 TetR/AcrR family transcriptional regulator [Mycolicibacterium sp. PAM1]MCV7054188.1 TetR/AcrR family transcriptional regulator [Mycolicibacterium gilvum]STZ41350.1 TetR family transcriptional regulator [Mycolicibacterium gilvum]
MALSRDDLLRAAADFLGRRPNATQDEIAAAVGVSRATLHRHFAGRPALMAALEELAVAEMRDVLEDARLQEDSAIDALRRLVTACEPVSPYLALLYSQSQELDFDSTLDAWQEIDTAITDLFLRGQRDGDFRPELPAAWLTEALYGLIGGTAWSVRAGRAAARDFNRLILDLLLNGATPR